MQARQIRIARRGLGWTQARLAAEAGLHPKAVAYWEGERRGSAIPHPMHTNSGLHRISAVMNRQGVIFGSDGVKIPMRTRT